MEGQKVDDKLSRRYLAGLMDGEGYISITVQTFKNAKYIGYKPTIKLVMTNPTVVRMVSEMFGGHVSVREYENPRFNNAFCWEARSFDMVRKVLDYIHPYLIIKKVQADILRDFLTTQITIERVGEHFPALPPEIQAKRARLYSLVKKLNHRGRLPAETKSECSPNGDEAIVRSARNELAEVRGNDVPALVVA